ncbi:MAG TPA: hypothetical protein VHG51_20455, partial [Longimicrobiaceae bacterium]|nr:hypothetical protein [Longimicrobiaceae bacterium]
ALAAATQALPRPGIPAPAPRWSADGRAAVTAAGSRYEAGWFRRGLLGDGYRALWTAPVRVDALDLSAFAGGLTPTGRGGGNQTRSLRLRGADGREYDFRSVDKDQARRLGPFRRATVGRVRQDQVAALNPAAALVAGRIEEAAGVLHAEPRLVVMPDDPALGAFRAEFGGMLGTLREQPDEGEDGAPGFAGSVRIVGTESLLERLREDPGDRVDARAFLAARLVDVYLGDWDRHQDQWRWARFGGDGGRRWVPVARDRDYALSHYRGALPALARRADPKAVRFDGEYRDLAGLLVKSREMDRRFLCPLSPATWDSAALALRAALPERVLDEAVRRMPPEYVALEGERLARTLRARRDRLPAAARAFREMLHEGGGCR